MNDDKKEKGQKMISDEEGVIINFAVRYAIGRRSYAPSSVIQYVMPRLPLLNDRTLFVLYNDMNDKAMIGDLGDERLDATVCKRFFEAIKTEIAFTPDHGLYDGIKITNADLIRMMDDEELFDFIDDGDDNSVIDGICEMFCERCVRKGTNCPMEDNDNSCPFVHDKPYKYLVMKWLRTEADGYEFAKEYGKDE